MKNPLWPRVLPCNRSRHSFRSMMSLAKRLFSHWLQLNSRSSNVPPARHLYKMKKQWLSTQDPNRLQTREVQLSQSAFSLIRVSRAINSDLTCRFQHWKKKQAVPKRKLKSCRIAHIQSTPLLSRGWRQISAWITTSCFKKLSQPWACSSVSQSSSSSVSKS